MDNSESQHDEIKNELEHNVKCYIKLDNEIREKTKELNEIKKFKKAYESKILISLDDIGVSTIQLNTGKLRLNQSKTKTPLNKDIILSVMKENIRDENVIKDILIALDNRKISTRKNIKRTFNRTGLLNINTE